MAPELDPVDNDPNPYDDSDEGTDENGNPVLSVEGSESAKWGDE